jgi:hypothetical protein
MAVATARMNAPATRPLSPRVKDSARRGEAVRSTQRTLHARQRGMHARISPGAASGDA